MHIMNMKVKVLIIHFQETWKWGIVFIVNIKIIMIRNCIIKLSRGSHNEKDRVCKQLKYLGYEQTLLRV